MSIEKNKNVTKEENSKKNGDSGEKNGNKFIAKAVHIFYMITDEQYLKNISGSTYGRLSRKIINFIRVFIVSGKKFMQDDCLTKSSAIAYTTLVSLIPTLTVALTILSVYSGMGDQKDLLFQKISKFLASHNLQKLNITPFFDAISGLIDNAASIGGIGAVVTIFSATAVLRNLEQYLNDIWKITKQRPIYLKTIYYWAALTLGPLMLIAGTTLATQLSSTLSSTNYNSAAITQEKNLWITGSKGEIGLMGPNYDLSEINIDNIDMDNQKVFIFKEDTMTFIPVQEEPITDVEFKKTVFSDIAFHGAEGWAVSKNGLFLHSLDSGKKWTIERRGTFSFTKIKMTDSNNGFIAAENGYLFSTKDGWNTWSVTTWPSFNLTIHDIESKDNYVAAVADKGYLITSNDGGQNWSLVQLPESKIGKYFTDLLHVNFYDKNTFIITGDDGLILISNDSAMSWKSIKFKSNSYYASFIQNPSTMFIGGEKGTLIYTNDSGSTWKKINPCSSDIKKIFSFEGKIWVIGENGLVINSSDNGKSWKGVKGTSIGIYLINFFAPFVFIWCMFLLIYIAMPNAKIPIKPAALGASFTGAVWVIFIFSFIVYVKSFADGTFAVYGALAAFPLFLLLIYTSVVIILFGAEVAYTLMYPETYLNMKSAKHKDNEINLMTGISVLFTIYKNFETGKGETTHEKLVPLTMNNTEELDYYLKVFRKDNLIQDKKGGGLIPTNSSANIKILSVIDSILEASMEIKSGIDQTLVKKLSSKFADLKKAREKILGNETLADMIKG